MYISKLKAKNWRNFTDIDVTLSEITYIVGANASGKSNFLDIFRFLRDIVNPNGGGLQKAVQERGGMTKLRCLAARQTPDIEIRIELVKKKEELDSNTTSDWTYCLVLSGDKRKRPNGFIKSEIVKKDNETILERPDPDDRKDEERLTQTALELKTMNQDFREIAGFFHKTLYLHLVPQLLKYRNQLALSSIESDPFGQGFLEMLADRSTTSRVRQSRLKRIETLLKKVIPTLESLELVKDDAGHPHLQIKYNHWRKNGATQQEDQFSDGTLRLISLIWTLLSSDDLILLEEPELSLHINIIEEIPDIIRKAITRRNKESGQVLVSTHSDRILIDKSIDGNSILYIKLGQRGESSTIQSLPQDRIEAIKCGMPPADVVFPLTGNLEGRLFT